MIVAPIATPVRDDSRLATKSIWLPPGTWIEWFTGTQLQGPAKIDRSFALDEIPVYVKAGAIIPMKPNIITIFPGGDGETRLYEDSGDGLGYKSNEFAWTTIRHAGNKIEILPAQGSYAGMPASRGYEIRLVNTLPPESVSGGTWTYDGPTLTTIVTVPPHPVNQRVEVTVNAPAAPPELVNGVRGEIARLRTAMEILDASWPNGWSPDIVIDAAQTGRRITLKPATARAELEKLHGEEPAIIDAIAKMDVSCSFTALALNHLGHATTCVAAPAK
jgi:alpha-glucosidase